MRERGLTDDTPDVIQHRIQNQKFTVPILKYEQCSDRVLTINGDLSADAVVKEIADYYFNSLQNHS